MARIALPQNYQIAAPSIGDAGLIEDFENAGDWINGGSTGTPTFGTDTTYFKTGTKSYYLDQAAGSGSVKRIKYFGPTGKNLSAVDTFHIWTYWPYGKVSTNTLIMYFSTGASGVMTNNHNVTMGATNTGTQKKGWNLWTVRKSQFSAGGTGVDWSNVNNVQFFHNAVAGPDRVYIDSLYCGTRARPQLLFTMDDSITSQKAACDTAMTTYGIPVTLFTVPSLVDGGGYLTKTELRSLEDAGHLIACHHENEFQTYADGGYAVTRVVQDWITDNGFSPIGRSYLALPGGKTNPTVRAAMVACGMKAVRGLRGLTYSAGPPEYYESVTSYDQENTALGVADLMCLNAINLATGVTLAQAKAAIDYAITAGTTQIFYAHAFGAGAGSNQFDSTEWGQLLAYAKERKMMGLIDIKRMDDWYNGLTFPRRAA